MLLITQVPIHRSGYHGLLVTSAALAAAALIAGVVAILCYK